MNQNLNFDLTDYQQAILTEMGISSWQVIDNDKTKDGTNESLAAGNAPKQPIDIPQPTEQSKQISKDEALAKLSQLKTSTQKPIDTQDILIAIKNIQEDSVLFNDVLIALGMDAVTKKHITQEEIQLYSSFPFAWLSGQGMSLNKHQLTTPALKELLDPVNKKQLWQLLQNGINVDAEHS